MPTLIAGVLAVIVLYSLLQMFRAANPVVLARAIKIGGGVVALAVAAFTGIKGELAVAVPLGIFGAGLLGWSPFGASGFGNIGRMFGGSGTQRSPGQTSQVRSQFLDMTLDHDSGELSGQIVAGPYAGHSLGEFDLQPQAREALARLYRHYLRHPVLGGWYDQFDRDGKSLVDFIPASSFYHILCAIAEADRVFG